MKSLTKLVLVAAIVAGPSSIAWSQEALDETTGLRTEFFYAPLYQLEEQGAPISTKARVYLWANHQLDAGFAANVSFNALASGPRAQAAPPSEQRKLRYDQAWAFCQNLLDRTTPKTGQNENERYVRGGACMTKLGYRL
jgi:hypothetical protein